jgi:Beta-lactamase
MSRYVMLELHKGKNEKGAQLVSESNLVRRRETQIKITDKMSYGLGLFIENDHGINLIHHGGNNMGFTTDLYFAPAHGFGVVMLTNAGGANTFRKAMRRRMIEILFDGNAEAGKSLDFALDVEKKTIDKALAKMALEPPAAWASELLGTYKNENLGTLTLRAEGKSFMLDAGEWKSPFGKLTESDGVVKVVLLSPPLTGLDFTPGEKDGHKTLTLDDAQHTYVFVR